MKNSYINILKRIHNMFLYETKNNVKIRNDGPKSSRPSRKRCYSIRVNRIKSETKTPVVEEERMGEVEPLSTWYVDQYRVKQTFLIFLL